MMPYPANGLTLTNIMSGPENKFNLSLDFGRQAMPVELPEIDNDSDSGILTGTK